jgi:hypothetical protein
LQLGERTVPKYTDSDLTFDFGYNVKPPKPKKPKKGKKQSAATRQAFALARKRGGELYGRSGS